MNCKGVLEARLEERGISKKELHKKMKDYFIHEGTGKQSDSWIEYNTFAAKISTNGLSASELLIASAILDIDMMSILDSIRMKLDSIGIISKKLESADYSREEFMKDHSRYKFDRVYSSEQIEENVFEFISYDKEIRKIAIEHFDFNNNKCKTVAFVEGDDLPNDPYEYIQEPVADVFNLYLSDNLYNAIIKSKKTYYLIYPEEKDLPEYKEEDYGLPF